MWVKALQHHVAVGRGEASGSLGPKGQGGGMPLGHRQRWELSLVVLLRVALGAAIKGQ